MPGSPAISRAGRTGTTSETPPSTQPAAVERERRKHPGEAARRPHRVAHVALVEHDLLAGVDFRGDDDERALQPLEARTGSHSSMRAPRRLAGEQPPTPAAHPHPRVERGASSTRSMSRHPPTPPRPATRPTRRRCRRRGSALVRERSERRSAPARGRLRRRGRRRGFTRASRSSWARSNHGQQAARATRLFLRRSERGTGGGSPAGSVMSSDRSRSARIARTVAAVAVSVVTASTPCRVADLRMAPSS